ncbi:trypsin-like peptidase domain-containing protein [Pseudonocardia eucalypti]|uniref:Trypsin-like peptidase domain-containing protein n=1 Tax=Pseudonocardia eucalypti TaxID=648755 RepID=A0ABP9QTR3_9PSEU|nr:putative serine protease PepD [Pseudonocardia eucalypti]
MDTKPAGSPIPYQTTSSGTSTPYGQLPPPPMPPPPGLPNGPSPAPRPKGRRRVAELAAIAVIAAAVGGGVGAWVGGPSDGPAGSAPASTGTLAQRAPTPGDLPAGPISEVAQRVLPSVVQLVGSTGEGSGVVLSADGLILTNAHVLESARDGGQLTAKFQDGSTAPVTVVGQDARADVAVVRARGVSGLTPIQLGNSDGLQVGQQVVAIGSPLGLAGTVTSGIVSALNRPVVTQQEQQPRSPLGGLDPFGTEQQQAPAQTSALDAIQTDAAINPGNSGGPLVDMQGRIVGLNSAIASLGGSGTRQSGSIGLGFSIPINQAKRIADELINTGHANQAQLGVSIRDGQPTGAQLAGVAPNSAAAKAGLQPGDVVTKIGTRLIEDADALVAAVNSAPPGGTISLTVTSGAGSPRNVSVTLDSVPAQ